MNDRDFKIIELKRRKLLQVKFMEMVKKFDLDKWDISSIFDKEVLFIDNIMSCVVTLPHDFAMEIIQYFKLPKNYFKVDRKLDNIRILKKVKNIDSVLKWFEV